MIPKFITDNNYPWQILPPGIHSATWEDINEVLCFNETRQHLLHGFSKGALSLFNAGCQTIYLDGSFVTLKPIPSDFDACWEPQGVNPDKLDPILLDFSSFREAQKIKYFGEFFPNNIADQAGTLFVDFFQKLKGSEARKGIIRIDPIPFIEAVTNESVAR